MNRNEKNVNKRFFVNKEILFLHNEKNNIIILRKEVF